MRKIQNRFSRLAVGFFVLAVVLALIVVIVVAIGFPVLPLTPAFGFVAGLIGLILSSWILAGVQCIVYSVLMEFVVNPRIENEHQLILISGLLILIATWTVPRGFPFVLLIIGFVSGCIVGYLLRDMYKYYS